MQYVIFGIILIAFAVLVIKSYAKKLAAGCCGAGGDTAKKVKVADKNKAHYPYAATLTVDGMMCAACETQKLPFVRTGIATGDRFVADVASKEALDYWSPVDWYNGGMEHTTLHLLYSRFWHKFLYDIGVVPTKEPYAKRTSHGMILGEGGEKMSKSRGNVVNPNDIVAQYGADTMRLHIMFIGDFEKAVSWSNEAVKGSKRFLDRCFNLQDIATDEEGISAKNEAIVHKTIKKVSQDIDELKMNTAIAAMMTMVNEFYANGCSKGDVEMLCLLLSPFAPHMVEEMWENMGFAAKYGRMAMQMDWPAHDEAKTVDSHVEMAVQVNGKLKGTVTVAMDSDEATVVAAAMDVDKVKKATEGMSVVKTILVKNKLVNLIVKPAK